MIEICNLRSTQPKYPYDVRVDRQSVWGNPYHMRTEAERNKVCEQYEVYIQQHLELIVPLKQLYKQHGRLRLFCWCAPKRCHAETLRKYILE